MKVCLPIISKSLFCTKTILSFQLMEQNGTDPESTDKLKQTHQRLRDAENKLNVTKKEVTTYQNMLEQSQGQYMVLEKKYNKAKRLVREFQQRELDMIHREEFYQQLLQEKDTEYNALVKNLKDRIIALEQDLLETQKKVRRQGCGRYLIDMKSISDM